MRKGSLPASWSRSRWRRLHSGTTSPPRSRRSTRRSPTCTARSLRSSGRRPVCAPRSTTSRGRSHARGAGRRRLAPPADARAGPRAAPRTALEAEPALPPPERPPNLLKRQYRLSVERLNQRLVAIYESSDVSPLDVVLGSGSIQEAIDLSNYLTKIGEEDREIAREVARSKHALALARKKTARVERRIRGETRAIAARQAQTLETRDALVGAKQTLDSTKQQKLVALDDLSAEERAAASEIDALQQVSADLGAQIRAAQARNAASQTATPSAAGLIWPVSGPITSPFGWRWGRMHEGIDIGVATARRSTPPRPGRSSTAAGRRLRQPRGDRPRQHVATAYGHQSSIAVGCGQQVSQGQVIGYVGCTGHCFGPHLHFEVPDQRQSGRPARIPLGAGKRCFPAGPFGDGGRRRRLRFPGRGNRSPARIRRARVDAPTRATPRVSDPPRRPTLPWIDPHVAVPVRVDLVEPAHHARSCRGRLLPAREVEHDRFASVGSRTVTLGDLGEDAPLLALVRSHQRHEARNDRYDVARQTFVSTSSRRGARLPGGRHVLGRAGVGDVSRARRRPSPAQASPNVCASR